MTPREKLELLRSYRAAGGTGSYASLLKGAKEYSNGGPKSKLPPLPSYTNIQPTQDNIRMQYTPIDLIQRDVAEVEARKLRVAKREKELQEYYSQPGMVSGMKRKPNPSEVRTHAESSVAYNDKLYSDPVGTLGPDIVMSVIPELMILKGPQQTISRGLNKINPLTRFNTKNIQVINKTEDVVETLPKFKSEIDWAKWNEEIPNNPNLLKEYHTIEESAKKSATWMKNPDGSSFKGTPEQFVQQNSSNFKKAFPKGSSVSYRGDLSNLSEIKSQQELGKEALKIKYNLTDEDTEVLEKLWERLKGKLNSGKYTTNDYDAALKYAKGDENKVLSLYTDIRNPKFTETGESFRVLEKDRQKLLSEGYDALITKPSSFYPEGENVLLRNNQMKSAIGNNGMFDMTNPNIYKALLPIGLGTGLYNKTTNN